MLGRHGCDVMMIVCFFSSLYCDCVDRCPFWFIACCLSCSWCVLTRVLRVLAGVLGWPWCELAKVGRAHHTFPIWPCVLSARGGKGWVGFPPGIGCSPLSAALWPVLRLSWRCYWSRLRPVWFASGCGPLRSLSRPSWRVSGCPLPPAGVRSVTGCRGSWPSLSFSPVLAFVEGVLF